MLLGMCPGIHIALPAARFLRFVLLTVLIPLEVSEKLGEASILESRSSPEQYLRRPYFSGFVDIRRKSILMQIEIQKFTSGFSGLNMSELSFEEVRFVTSVCSPPLSGNLALAFQIWHRIVFKTVWVHSPVWIELYFNSTGRLLQSHRKSGCHGPIFGHESRKASSQVRLQSVGKVAQSRRVRASDSFLRAADLHSLLHRPSAADQCAKPLDDGLGTSLAIADHCVLHTWQVSFEV